MKKISTLFLASLFSLSLFSQSKALSFDGADDYVSIPEKAGVLNGAAFTLETWVKPAASFTTLTTVLSKIAANTGVVLFFNGDPDPFMSMGETLECNLWTSASTYQVAYYPLPSSWTNQWHHIAVTYNGANFIMYVDGAEVSNTPFAGGSLPMNGGPVEVSRYSGSFPFNGLLDELRIWNVARTQAQIQAAKNTEVSLSTSNLTAYYRFNQGTANGNNVSITTLTDAVVTPNNGTLYNFAKTGTTSNFTNGYSSLTVLAVKDDSFIATKKQGTVNLNWKALANEAAILFEVERSTNGTIFTGIGKVNGTVGQIETSYFFTDAKPVATNYYRIKTTDGNGKLSYSKTIAVSFNQNGQALFTYPNPVKNTLQVQVMAPEGKLNVEIKDVSGKTVQSLQLSATGNTTYTSLDVSRLSKGLYIILAGKESAFFVKE